MKGKLYFLFIILFLNLILNKNIVYALTQEERELIAKVVKAEAMTECEEGRRLVIDTILNRVESESFPNSVEKVIFQLNQYAVPSKEVDDDILLLVMEEESSRLNDEVIFFRTKKYPSYGEPLFQVERHYFSKEKKGE